MVFPLFIHLTLIYWTITISVKSQDIYRIGDLQIPEFESGEMIMENVLREFMDFFGRMSERKAYDTVSILKELDARSSCTFEHSVNVAVMVMRYLKDTALYTDEEVDRWTLGALVHDAGKLHIPMYILHGSVFELMTSREKCIMMSHSFEGRDIIKNTALPKEALASAICHHISAKSLEQGFANADTDRPEWKELYGEQGVQRMLMAEVPWICNNTLAIKAVETITACDIVEALRSKNRSYKSEKKWSGLFQTDWIVNKNIKKGIADEDIALRLLSPDYREFIDQLQESGITSAVRELFRKEYSMIDVQIQSQDKIHEILENAERGRAFVKNNRFDKWTIRIPDFIEESSRPAYGTNPLIIRNPSFHYLIFPEANRQLDYSEKPYIGAVDEIIMDDGIEEDDDFEL